MAKFSERIGAVEKVKTLQLEDVNDDLRNSLWNLFYKLYDEFRKKYWRKVALHIAQYFRKSPADELPYQDYECRKWVKQYFYSLEWHGVYDFTEFIVKNHRIMTRERVGYDYHYHNINQPDLIKHINSILERELSGYRFISGLLTPITEVEEINEIEGAIQTAQQHKLYGTREHIKTALALLGKKPEPDYRNAIKEAISAVESITKQISDTNSHGLDGALTKLAKVSNIHGALKSGFLKLYGYSSDEGGIRHAILEEPNVGFAEAKYMIISCSAFVNYLVAKADEAGLLKGK